MYEKLKSFETAVEVPSEIRDSFNKAVDEAWNEYRHNGRLVDSLEDNSMQCAFSKGFLAAYIHLENLKMLKDEAANKIPEYSYLQPVYRCGAKPHWCVNDILACYDHKEKYSKHIYGRVIAVEYIKENHDWRYTFDDKTTYYEMALLTDLAFKENFHHGRNDK